MTNMNYCRFQNTLQDLRDCHEVMFDENEIEDLSSEEARARQQLIKVCCDIAQVENDMIAEIEAKCRVS